MTFASMVDDFLICGVWLLAGYILRQAVPFLRKCYLPASVLGGALALVFGPQVLDLVPIPQSFSGYAVGLINLVFTSLVWGVTINFKKIKSHLDYCCVQWATGYWQVALCGGLGILLVKIWPSLPQGWGLMAPFSFFAGHGTAVAMGTLFEKYGVAGNTDIGIILSTVGLISAMLFGTIFVNIGIRKGWATFVKPGDNRREGGKSLIPESERRPIGMARVSNSAVNNFLFQFAILMFVLWFGTQLFHFLGRFSPWIAKLPSTLFGIVGCLILWPLARGLKLDGYVDKPTVSTISGTLVDVLVLGAISTINLDLVSRFWLPLTLISVLGVVLTAAYSFVMCRKCCETEWFEKFIFTYGVCTGIVSTGFALHRMLDPEGKSIVPEAQGVTSGIQSPVNFSVYTLLIVLSIQNSGMELLVGLAFAAVLTILPWLLFRRGVRERCGR